MSNPETLLVLAAPPVCSFYDTAVLYFPLLGAFVELCTDAPGILLAQSIDSISYCGYLEYFSTDSRTIASTGSMSSTDGRNTGVLPVSALATASTRGTRNVEPRNIRSRGSIRSTESPITLSTRSITSIHSAYARNT